jgi:Formyl transferase, C-terminal domain
VAQDVVRWEKVERLAVFGGSWIVAALLPRLRALPWTLHVFTSPRHLADVVTRSGETLADALARLAVPYTSSEDINADPEAAAVAGPATLGIAFGAAWTFSPDFASRFAGPLLDFMGIPLPAYRGGAHYTWQILNRERRGACNLQVVLGGEESFHRGPILSGEDYRMPDTARTPQDYFDAAVEQESAFILRFLDAVRTGTGFTPRPLDESRASYFPFLNTLVHGWIDWSGSAEEVARFIDAFGEPYAGASTLWRRRRVFLKEAQEEADGGGHSFARGLVFRNDARGVWACTRDGSVRIRRVVDEDGHDLTREIAPGSRFITPTAKLEEAIASELVYDPAGPRVERML